MNDYLLDTQAFIWFVENNLKLPVKTKNLLEHKDSNLFVSIASLYEDLDVQNEADTVVKAVERGNTSLWEK